MTAELAAHRGGARSFAMVGLRDVVDGAAAVVGIRRAPEPPHRVLGALAPGMEVRAYDARVAYEARMDSRDPSRAFGRLFRTIAGANGTGAKIPMTTPVETGPRGGGAGYAMRFFLPPELDAPPKPNDAGLSVARLPAGTYAVHRFAGLATDARLLAAEDALRAALDTAGWRATGPALAWLYDPPFAVPALRRNEVAIPVERA